MTVKGAIAAAVAVARQERPELTFEAPAFAAFLLRREGLQPSNGGDLLVAYLALQQHPAAMKCFESEYLASVRATVDAVGARSELEDVLQELRRKLFIDGRLDQYSGRSPLRSWLRQAAARTASTLMRPLRRASSLELPEDVLSIGPEEVLLKSNHRDAFAEAFRDALRTLTPRERNVLRLNALSGMSIDEVGASYRVHRATAARWIQRAKESLIQKTREGLALRLGVGPEEIDSLIRLLRRDLDESLLHHLKKEDP